MTKIVWFKNNLRTADNTPLSEACNTSGNVIGVYFFDPRNFEKTEFGFPKTGNFRAQFMVESVATLQKNLKKLNIPLMIFHQQPEDILPEFIEEHNVDAIYTQNEWTHEEKKVTQAVREKTQTRVLWFEYYDQFLFHPNDIPFESFYDIPKLFTEFRKKCEAYAKVRPTLPVPLPQKQFLFNTEIKSGQLLKTPSLADLNLTTPRPDKRTAFPFKGGETAGSERLEDYIWNTQNIATYKQTRNQLIGTAYSSKFSAWLANGSLSARTIYWQIKEFEKEVRKNQDTYWMLFELIWRDFFKYISLKHGNKLFTIGGILNKNYDWGTSEEKKQNWILGKTKYPFVNANMKELARTGWMSNRGRQNVASFWAKELKQDWRIGASYFESQLIDYDVHSNWGNWQYVSGVGNDPRNRNFNINKQAERYDPDGTYVSLWLDSN